MRRLPLLLVLSLQLVVACGDKDDTGLYDADHDGFTVDQDCDDTDPAIHPGADEYCDGLDYDCDGATDEADALDALPWYGDADHDGYGWFYGPPTMACTAPSGFVADDTDCDDSDPAVGPTSGDPCVWTTSTPCRAAPGPQATRSPWWASAPMTPPPTASTSWIQPAARPRGCGSTPTGRA